MIPPTFLAFISRFPSALSAANDMDRALPSGAQPLECLWEDGTRLLAISHGVIAITPAGNYIQLRHFTKRRRKSA